MKNSLVKVALSSLMALALSSVALADPFIEGSIGFSGSFTTDATGGDMNTATQIFFGSNTKTLGTSSGAYTGVAELTPVHFNNFSFASLPTPDLWDFTVGLTNYSFQATSVNVATTTNTITLWGVGTAAITGYSDTGGNWVITGNNLGVNFTFSASTDVPDGGTTALLVGLGMLGMGVVARRRK